MNAMNEAVYDVAVIGAGPAGGMAAYTLARQGVRVILLEKEQMPRYKTCGGGLVWRGRKLLPFDISPAVEREFASIALYFSHYRKRAEARREQPLVTMVMRDRFDQLIAEQAQMAGAVVRDGCALLGVTQGEPYHQLQTSAGIVSARFVVGADGAKGVTARLCGWHQLQPTIPAIECEVRVPDAAMQRLQREARFDFDAIPHGYGWCFPKANHLSLGVIVFEPAQGLGMKQRYAAYLQALGIGEVLEQHMHGFVVPVQPKAVLARNRVLLVGDAAALADVLTAEGISEALNSGVRAAQALLSAQLHPLQAEHAYQAYCHQEFLPQWRAASQRARLAYGDPHVSRLVLGLLGQRLADHAADVFMGERLYTEGHPLGLRAWRRRLFG